MAIIQSFAISHIGHRQENQDSFCVLEDPQSKTHLVIVADGMGGHLGGALAAQTIIESARKTWSACIPIQDPNKFLKHLIEDAHNTVLNIQRNENAFAQSTLCALLLHQHYWCSAHVGDSRVIQIANGKVLKRTLDHSIAQLAQSQGKITEDELASHPDQNKLYSSIGGPIYPKFDIQQYESVSCRFVVCSDGFWEFFNAKELGEFIEKVNSQHQLEMLVETKLSEKKRHDNVTAVILEVSGEDTSDARKNTNGVRLLEKANNTLGRIIIVSICLLVVCTILLFWL
ncbi:PP2C family protein-serine/threonine phosphatase [Glaciecola sp. 1036]|uniref:PP2C family protein-serine/threonine phosphatase n=1 Tax=Alteromonadaceae TaxID=72275 RepID=UPI003D006BD8